MLKGGWGGDNLPDLPQFVPLYHSSPGHADVLGGHPARGSAELMRPVSGGMTRSCEFTGTSTVNTLDNTDGWNQQYPKMVP